MKPIILIGPIGAGKTTVGNMLAKKLNLPFYSLDEEEKIYTKRVGYNARHHALLKKKEGIFAAYDYARGFFDEAVIHFLKVHKSGVLDFGGGHPIVPDAKKQRRIIRVLKKYPYIFLLIPTRDVKQSLEILRKRNKVTKDEDFNILYFKDKTFWTIAKHVIYTQGKTPKQTCEDILELLS